MYNYLKNCIHEAPKEALWEKEVNKGRKTIFWNVKLEKERQNKKNYFWNGLVLRIIMTKYNTRSNKQRYKEQ